MGGAPLQGKSLDEAAVIAFGSNLAGEYSSPRALLEAAAEAVAALGVGESRRSSWWRSAAWPDAGQPPFLNGVMILSPPQSPQALIEALQAIERGFGRRPGPRNAPRTLDLDLIAHGRMVADGQGLALPHPRAHERLFVMGPLAEIAPGWRHPVLGLTARALAASAAIGVDAAPAGP
jgi:2-amino-4-hydroxy-6-hydroxymethyldihydropteridine diphosphokinase